MKIGFLSGIVGMGLGISVAHADPTCAEHCGKYRAASILDKLCEKTKGITPWVAPVIQDDIICDCPCSCVVTGTLILTPSGEFPVESFKKGDVVTLPLKESQEGKVVWALSSPVVKHPVMRVRTSLGEVMVSKNHLFVTPKKKVVAAEKLRLGSVVLDSNNAPVVIEGVELVPSYTGALHNFILKPGSRRMADHIYVANGLQSGDLELQDANDRMALGIKKRLGKMPYISNGKIIEPKG